MKGKGKEEGESGRRDGGEEMEMKKDGGKKGRKKIIEKKVGK
jgi:hypothetical protein